MITVLYSGLAVDWEDYHNYISNALINKGIKANVVQECPPDQVDYIVFSPNGPVQDFSVFPNLKAALGLWAGVEKIVNNTSLSAPLCRMVDAGLREGMREWVAGHSLRYHLGFDQQILHQDGVWRKNTPPLARQRTIGILGIGELGRACGQSLHQLGFNVAGWSKSQKQIDGISCYSGNDGLDKTLSISEILVLLLPQTDETFHIINAKTLAKLPRGAFILNPGRGPLIDDDALLGALNSGHISHATLDVFDIEPLPADHPFWAHPKVTVTPHIASETRAITAADVIADNIERGETGQPFLYLVDRNARY